jgi:RNase P/RNase MRP subunit POP5
MMMMMIMIMTVIPVTVGATGTISKPVRKYLNNTGKG